MPIPQFLWLAAAIALPFIEKRTELAEQKELIEPIHKKM
ncbi:MAG: hypothetical protein ACI9JM_000558 [Halioglobus sp.]|jgi:hypothetical protein